MDSPALRAAPAARDSKRRGKKKSRVWRKRLHRRKTVAQPPTMQSVDKRGPKKIPEEWEQSAVWPSSKKPPQEAQPSHDSRRALRFACSLCKDSLEYVPKDLVRHFEENHRGSAPVFPCHACTFKAHEFSYLQVHLLSHKDTFSSCNICNDNVKRSWSELSAHLTTHHCQNGKYSCEMCRKFSTGDVRVFLEHMCVHLMGLEGPEDVDLSLHTRDNNQFGSAAQSSRCQYCGFEASQKWLLTKHINANHGQKKKTELHSISKKPNETVPKMKPRLTRSAVREMCWLTQDCLSLPGREFLDKYCHLSDPQTTLEETQQFLMKSVAGETGDQKWTKALKTVLSNVPQDMNLHPKSENGVVSSSADLTVLTVKNKITLAQNGATYAKRRKTAAPAEKETPPPESAAADAHCDQSGCQSDLNNVMQTEAKLNNDASASTHNGPSECALMQENRENRELKPDRDGEELVKPDDARHGEDRLDVSSQPAVTDEGPEQTPACKAPPKSRRRTRRRRRSNRSKTRRRQPAATALKIVLKKNPEKEKQWVTQSSLSPSDGGPAGDDCGEKPQTEVSLNAPTTLEKTWTKALQTEQPDVTEAPDAQPEPEADGPPVGGCENTAGGTTDSSPNQEKQDVAEESPQLPGTEIDANSAESLQLVSSDGVPDPHVGDGATPPSISTKPSPSPLPQPAIKPPGERNSGDLHLAPPLERSDQSDGRIRDVEVPADSLSGTELPAGNAFQQEALLAAASARRCQPIPKHRERSLKLTAIKPSQLIKRPARDQPVVVLNHPDADIPEVTRIMEVINRYSGEVQKVVLSRRTLNALSATPTETQDPADPPSLVRERFNLKLKLRRLGRKKYEVVGGASLGRDAPKKFRCWFCGRGFASQETWMVHRQRHLMDWKRPNCENS